ncbi:hypothetical protein [Moritella sp. Urea-trap-13]|uniref:hypothetical protein n=1 Tax=Moritella sp. Urea-trap-13 TaxID=2058327 RepID=UPI000C346EBE|nr:hypothetical protein [Moritella sp. Urea-trap-13]PKH05963.1 hypothetical protein CXF93_08465 [Moritella sp. Urea-trap-13]
MNKSAVKDLSANALEVALDNGLENGILKDIPVFGTAIKVAELTMSIRDHFFLQKLSKFIFKLESLSDKEKSAINDFSRSPDSEKISNKIIQVIDNVTDIEKAELISILFISYCSGEINKSNFLRSVDTIHNYFIDDITEFVSASNLWFYTYEDLEQQNLENLVGSPLIREQFMDRQDLIRSGRESEIGITNYENSKFGEIFRKALT